jgi:plasmid stabilization system protein ParE
MATTNTVMTPSYTTTWDSPFYLLRGDRLDVLRVLHASRDVPAPLQEQ